MEINLSRPIAGLAFQAKLLMIDYQASRQASQEMWGSDSTARRARQGEIYAQRRMALVHDTLNRGEGSSRFLARLAVEAGELGEDWILSDFEVPNFPDFSEVAGGPRD